MGQWGVMIHFLALPCLGADGIGVGSLAANSNTSFAISASAFRTKGADMLIAVSCNDAKLLLAQEKSFNVTSCQRPRLSEAKTLRSLNVFAFFSAKPVGVSKRLKRFNPLDVLGDWPRRQQD